MNPVDAVSDPVDAATDPVDAATNPLMLRQIPLMLFQIPWMLFQIPWSVSGPVNAFQIPLMLFQDPLDAASDPVAGPVNALFTATSCGSVGPAVNPSACLSAGTLPVSFDFTTSWTKRISVFNSLLSLQAKKSLC